MKLHSKIKLVCFHDVIILQSIWDTRWLHSNLDIYSSFTKKKYVAVFFFLSLSYIHCIEEIIFDLYK